IGLDVVPYYKAITEYEEKPSVIEYAQLHATIESAEDNKSIETVTTTQLLNSLHSDTKVYFVKESEKKISILAKENNSTMLVKELPAMSMTFTLESRLLDRNIAYKWVEEKEKPQMFVVKIMTSPQFFSFVLLAGLLYFFMLSSGMSFFKKAFNTLEPEEIEGDFSSLIGYEDIKTEARQLLHIITKQEQYAQYGIEETFNILFSGRAGTGKSRFAQYLAKELEMPLVSATGSLDEVYVGSGAKKVRDMFAQAYKLAQKSEHNACILFIDEAQSLLKKRGRSSGHNWEDDTRNELLAHLDGVEKSQEHHIIVIMASNFHENNLEMDEAMLRRFKKKIHFREPNLEERKAILLHYLAEIEKKEERIDVTYLAKNMSGLTPATIESIVQEAGLMALREERLVSTDILLQAFERTVVGESSREVSKGQEKVRKTIAVHEIGHFLVEYHRAVLQGGELEQIKEATRILKISSESISQIGALGFAMREQHDEMLLQSIEEMEWELRQLYGGIAAEQTVYGKSGITTGSADDIQKATKLLQHMINQNNVYGTAKLNYEALGVKENRVSLMEEKAQAFFEESIEIIEKYEGLLIYLSGVLMTEWSLSKEEIFEHIEIYVNESVLPV
ncbi:MAG: AAA family ATPase, partial [Campylobacterota bacterium]|nr:AAA family ATPase [Campylobacterota bacterium]